MTIRVKLNNLENAGPKQTAIARQAVELLEQALNHPKFKQQVIGARFAAWHQDEQARVRKLPVARVWQIIETGQELGTSKDFEIDLHVHLRWMRRDVLGWTDIGGPIIHTNSRFVKDCIRDDDAAALAAHWLHEWLHVAGFFHEGGNHTRGDAAYVLGDLVEVFIHEHLLDNAQV